MSELSTSDDLDLTGADLRRSRPEQLAVTGGSTRHGTRNPRQAIRIVEVQCHDFVPVARSTQQPRR